MVRVLEFEMDRTEKSSSNFLQTVYKWTPIFRLTV